MVLGGGIAPALSGPATGESAPPSSSDEKAGADVRASDDPSGASQPRLGIALSGGGHRASLWALGALFAVRDTDTHVDTVSIASVSGGSITNGVLAAHVDFQKVDREQLEATFADAIAVWAKHGLFFSGSTDHFVGTAFLLFGALGATLVGASATLGALLGNWHATATVVVALGLFITGIVGVAALARRLKGQFLLPLTAGVSVVMATSLGGMTLARLARSPLPSAALALACLATLIVVGKVTSDHFARRSEVVDQALDEGLLGRASLTAIQRTVHHVWCATDLAAGDHAYFSSRLVYGHSLGVGTPLAGFKLSTVVQASACLPGAFAPREIGSGTVAAGIGDSPLVLTDGGVYDNMADQWEFGYRNRIETFQERGKSLFEVQPYPADQLVVVNASRGFTRSPIRTGGLIGEVVALMRCKDILYDVSTAVRRRYLVDMFNLADVSKDGLTGVLVHIGQVPARVPTVYAKNGEGGRKARALEAQAFLDRLALLDPDVDWDKVAEANGLVPTTLGPVGVEAACRLLHHSYVLARINLYVILNRGRLPDTNSSDADVIAAWGSSRFADLVARATSEEGL